MQLSLDLLIFNILNPELIDNGQVMEFLSSASKCNKQYTYTNKHS